MAKYSSSNDPSLRKMELKKRNMRQKLSLVFLQKKEEYQ